MPARQPASSLISLPAAEAARLAALERLFAGALHTFNNALTTIGGEASFLLDEAGLGDAKPDPAVEEACQVVLAQVERCGRLTHQLLRRRAAGGASEEVDAASVVVELRELLAVTLGSHVQLAVEAPDEPLVIPGARETLELLILSLAQHAAESAYGGVELTLALDGRASEPCLDLRVEAGGLAENAAEAVLDPQLAEHPLARARLEGIAFATGALDARCHARRTGPCSWSARLRFGS